MTHHLQRITKFRNKIQWQTPKNLNSNLFKEGQPERKIPENDCIMYLHWGAQTSLISIVLMDFMGANAAGDETKSSVIMTHLQVQNAKSFRINRSCLELLSHSRFIITANYEATHVILLLCYVLALASTAWYDYAHQHVVFRHAKYYFDAQTAAGDTFTVMSSIGCRWSWEG